MTLYGLGTNILYMELISSLDFMALSCDYTVMYKFDNEFENWKENIIFLVTLDATTRHFCPL